MAANRGSLFIVRGAALSLLWLVAVAATPKSCSPYPVSGEDPGDDGGGEPPAGPVLGEPRLTSAEASCEPLDQRGLRVGQEQWRVSVDTPLFTTGVYHCVAVAMTMETPTGRVFALGHFGDPEPFQANLLGMIEAMEAAGGQRETLETVVGQGGANEPYQLPLTLVMVRLLGLNLVHLVYNLSEDDADEPRSLMEFEFDGSVYRYKRPLVCLEGSAG